LPAARADLLNVTDAKRKKVTLALPVFEGKLVSYYLPAAGFTARLGWEWSF